MSSCTLNYIEKRFRQSDPQKADYFNNMNIALWKKLNKSLLFPPIIIKGDEIKLIANIKNTNKRKKQEEFIDEINNSLNSPIISITNNNVVKINLSPLFGDDINSHVEPIRNIAIKRNDITPYLAKGYDVKGSILKMINDNLLANRETYIQSKDEFGNLIPGKYIINHKSEKVTRAKNPNAAAKQIVNVLKDKIESEFPGVNVIVNSDSYPVSFKISPWKLMLEEYEKSYASDQLKGTKDKSIKEKYFSEGNETTDKEILTKIAQSKHPLNKLAEYLIPFSKGIGINLLPVEYIMSNNMEASAVYSTYGLGNEEVIRLAEFSNFKGLGSEPTIIHEILHGLTVNWLDTVKKSDPLYKEFNRLYQETILKLGNNSVTDNYALTNIKEFAVALFTDAAFINKIKELPSDNPTKYSNLFEEVLNHILKLFKLTNDKSTLYTDAFAVVTNIINSQKKLEKDIISDFNEFEDLQDDLDNYYIEDYLPYTNENTDIVEQNKSVIKSTIFELNPTITEEKIKDIYNNYEALMNKQREGKAIPFDIFKSLIDKYQVFNYKNTYIFGNYDVNTGTFITRLNSSPSSKELLAEAIPNIVNNGIDFISFVPKDYADKLVRSGYISSKNSFKYNFKGELMDKFAVASNDNVFKKIFNKNFNQVTSEDIENFNESIKLQYNPVEVNSNLISQASNDASKILETYLKQFGITIKDINLIKDTFNIDEIGFVDLLSKIIYVKNKKDLPSFAGEAIAYMMQYNSLVKEIINNLIQTNAILIPKNLYNLNQNGNKVYNYNKLDKTEFFKYIGNLISEDLNNKLEGNYDRSLVAKIKQLIKTFFDYITKSDIALINKNIGIITNNILQQNKKLITSSLYKPGAFGKPTQQVNIEDALKSDKFGASIIFTLSNQGFILTGSTALSEQGTILRPDENPLHEIDWVSPFSRKETEEKFLKSYPNAIKVRDIYGDGYITDSYLIAPEGYSISNYKADNFNGKIIINSYDVIDSKGNVVGTYRLQKQESNNQSEEVVTGVEGKVIDFFSYENYSDKNLNKHFNYKSKEGTIIQLANWKDIFKAKLDFARYKDIWDYNRFIPNENINLPVTQNLNTNLVPNNINEQFAEAKKLENKDPETNEEFNKKILYSLMLPNISSDRFNRVFSQTDPEEFNKYRQEKVKKIINSFAERFGISIETINSFQDRSITVNNKTISYSGVANLANKTIKYLDGDDAALTEEIAHFLIAMLPKDSQEYLGLKNYIQSTPEYQLYYDKYLEVYNNNVNKTEEEIMGKVLANSLLGNKEQVPLSLKSIVKQIINFFKNLINPIYQQEFEKSLNNINHLFFTENFENLFDESNITFDELYSLDFLSATDVNVFKQGSQEIINTVLQNLKRQRQKFIESKQANSVKKVDDLIEILTNTAPEETTASKMQTYIEASVIELELLKKSFAEFEASGVIYDLSQKDYKNLSRAEQEAFTQEDRMKHLNYIVSAVITVQNLNAFIVLLEENFAVFNRDKDSLAQYRQVLNNLDNSNPEVALFKTILNNTEINKISELRNTYNKLSKELLKVIFKSLNTNEQQKFLETVEKNETVPNTTDTANIKRDHTILSTFTDKLIGKFNRTNFLKNVKQNLTPTSFQSDMFLLLVDNANASFRQVAMNATLKTVYEYDLLQSELNQLGVTDESWISAKNPNGKKSFKLLQKFNYKLFKGTLTNKLVDKNLKSITNYASVINEVKDNNKQILEDLFNTNFNSPKELQAKIFQLHQDQLISDRLLKFLLNYTQALETGYTLRFLEANVNLSNNDKNILEQYRNEYIRQLNEKVGNLDFTKKKLPFIDPKFDFNTGVVSQDQFLSVAKAIVKAKKDKLIAKEVTVPQYVTDSKGNVNLNPVYESQMSYVEGLLNYFKQTIEYVENNLGDVQLNKFDILYFGEDFFFNLGDKGNVKDIEYIDPEYKKLENDLNSPNENTRKIAETKLKILKKMQEQNLAENKPANFLPKVEKYDSSQYLSDSKEFRTYLTIFLKVLPSALVTTSLATGFISAPIIYFTSQWGINKLIKLAYYLHKGMGLKSFSLLFKSGFREDLREELNFANKSFNNPREAASIAAKILQKINPKNWNKNNKESSNVIDTNDFLLGESNIPKPFENKDLADVEYSTDFLTNRKTYTQAVSNYKTNIRWESWIRMVGDFQARRTGFNSTEVINVIKDRFFYNKFYNSSAMVSGLRWFVANNSRRVLSGNIPSGIMNLLLGSLNILIHTNGTTFPKAFIQVLQGTSQKLYDNSGIKPVFSDFVNMLTGSDTSRNRLAVFSTLKDLFLGRNSERFTSRLNVDTHISKYLRKNRGTGFTNFDESTNYLVQGLKLTDSKALQDLGEKLIEKLAINQYFLTEPLVNELGQPIKNLKNYLKLVNGKIVLDKSKLSSDKVFLKTSLNTKTQSFIENGVDITDNISISNPTPLDLNLQPLTDLELDIFLNETISNDINNIMEKSQGAYNIFTKSVWRNTAFGLIFLQFKDFLVTSLKSTYSSEKVYNDFTSSDMGVFNVLYKYFSSIFTNEKDLHADSYQNLLIANNLRADTVLKELNYLKSFLKNSKNKKIDTKLKELATDNVKYRNSIKTKSNVPYKTSLDTFVELTQFDYINKYKDLSDEKKLNKIVEDFNLNPNSKTFNEQKNFILNLLKQRFEANQSITNNEISKLEEYDINQNFIEIVQAYDKLKNNLTADVKAINRLTNFILVSIALNLAALLFFMLKEIPEEEEPVLESKLTFFGWYTEFAKNASMSLTASYFPFLELDAYGFTSSKGKSKFEYTKTAPTLSDIIKISSSILNSATWKTEATVQSSKKKIEEFAFMQELAKERGESLPFFKPVLKEIDGEYQLVTDPKLYEDFAALFIPSLISDNFELYSNEKAQKHYKEIKDKTFIQLMALKALNVRFARFSDAGGSVESKLEREKLYEELVESQENSEEEPFE